MNTEETTAIYPAKVAKIIDEFRVVINRGASHGVKHGQRFLVYGYDEDIIDPDTGKSLGQLELVRGTGRVSHVQTSIATIRSDMKSPASASVRRIIKETPNIYSQFNPMARNRSETEEELSPAEDLPFESVAIGDLAKPI